MSPRAGLLVVLLAAASGILSFYALLTTSGC
ncbi:MAG: hypothetical protein QOG31_227 [Thermoplasmata archaeon]|jgi:hypothetical protein|nr:hypothetical protein [Thermoplasmata archaeon]